MKKIKMPSSFTILFSILVVVAILTWFVPSGEYVNVCYGENNEKYHAYEITKNDNTEFVCLIDGNKKPIDGKELNNNQSKYMFSREEITVDENAKIKYEYEQKEPNRQGIWQVLQSPINGIIAAMEVIVYMFAIGGFVNVVIQTGALNAGILILLQKFKNKEMFLIPILMILFAIGGTTFGMAEETLAFYAILLPILFRAGFDNVVGTMVIMLGAGVGVLASTINPFSVGIASSVTNISSGDGIIDRFILWLIMLTITILYVLRYANKVYNQPFNSLMYDKYEELKNEYINEEAIKIENPKIIKLILILFGLTFSVMIISILPWESVFGITLFEQITQWINTNLKIFSGDSGIISFGNWFLPQLAMLFLFSGITIGIIARKNNILKENVLDIYIAGVKDMISVALIVGLARGIQTILATSGMDATLLYYASNMLANLPQNIFSILTYLLYLPLSFFVPSTSGLATATMPIMGDLSANIYGVEGGKIITITAFSAASGLINLITPTSGVVMGGLLLSKIEYPKWLKIVMPLLIIIFIVTIIYIYFISTFNIFS